jgi:hypothetical protein
MEKKRSRGWFLAVSAFADLIEPSLDGAEGCTVAISTVGGLLFSKPEKIRQRLCLRHCERERKREQTERELNDRYFYPQTSSPPFLH